MRKSEPLYTRYSLCFLLCVFFSPFASAVDYYWTVDNLAGQFPSASAACDAKRADSTTYPSSSALIHQSGVTADCMAPGYYGGEVKFSNAKRHGDSCPEGQTVNPLTGGCEPDCSDSAGKQLAARGPLSPVMTDGDGVRSILPGTFLDACFDGCSYEIQSSFSDRLGCYLVPGSTAEGFCNYLVTGSGQSCPASNYVPAGGGDPLNTAPPPEDPGDPPPDPGCPPPYVWNGDFCQQDPGDGDGGGDGTGDGSGDGSGDGGGGDGGGSGDGGSGDGSGDGGSGDGGGDGPGDGSGSGDGGGSGDGSGSGGGSGDGDGDCTGDDCGAGDGAGLSAPEKGTFDDAIADYEQKIDETLQGIKDKSGQFGDLIKQKLAVQLSSGNAVLPCFDTVIMGESVGFCFSTYSEQLSILRNLLLFLATVIALYIIFREDK